MNVLSLFDGLSGARIALENIGVTPNYYASEIDESAMAISRYHYPNNIQLGDVTKITREMIDGDVDLLIGGSPCQSFSATAGLKKEESGLEKGASTLFWAYVNVLKLFRPKYFVLENVASMKPKDKERITQVIKEVYPNSYCIKIDSALLTAQSRKRLYWTNIPKVDQPQDIGLLLKDVLDDSVTDKLSYHKVEGIKVPMCKSYLGTNLNFRDSILGKKITELFTYDYEEGDPGAPIHEKETEPRPNRGYKIYFTDIKNRTRANRYRIEHIRGIEQKSRCLGTGCLSIANTSGTGVFVNGVYRSLTILECERLQGLPDGFTKLSRDKNGKEYNSRSTHRARAVGNGFTIPVISHILSFIPEIRSGEWK